MSEEQQCELPAYFRYTWPGHDENFVCFAHAIVLVKIANAIGFHLQLIELPADEMVEHTCTLMMTRDDNAH